MNQISLIGNNTKDIEVQKTADGKSFCRFNLAVQRKFDREKTDFFSCTAWDKRAETIALYVHKGNKVAVTGRIEFNTVEKEGKNTTYHNVIVDDIEFLTPKSAPTAPTAQFEVPDDGDIPF